MIEARTSVAASASQRTTGAVGRRIESCERACDMSTAVARQSGKAARCAARLSPSRVESRPSKWAASKFKSGSCAAPSALVSSFTHLLLSLGQPGHPFVASPAATRGRSIEAGRRPDRGQAPEPLARAGLELGLEPRRDALQPAERGLRPASAAPCARASDPGRSRGTGEPVRRIEPRRRLGKEGREPFAPEPVAVRRLRSPPRRDPFLLARPMERHHPPAGLGHVRGRVRDDRAEPGLQIAAAFETRDLAPLPEVRDDLVREVGARGARQQPRGKSADEGEVASLELLPRGSSPRAGAGEREVAPRLRLQTGSPTRTNAAQTDGLEERRRASSNAARNARAFERPLCRPM